NVRQTKRMTIAVDAVYQTAVDLRLLFGLDDLNGDYFAMRLIPFRGEKEAVRYWMEQDPAYFQLFQATLAERGRAQKVALYCQLADMTLAPLGRLMSEDTTSVTLESKRDDIEGAVYRSAPPMERIGWSVAARDLISSWPGPYPPQQLIGLTNGAWWKRELRREHTDTDTQTPPREVWRARTPKKQNHPRGHRPPLT